MEARPEAKVVWRQGVREVGGQEVAGRRVITDGRESELVLDIVKTEELGSYTCAAKNSLGEASALLILPGDTYFSPTIQDQPHKPLSYACLKLRLIK